MLGGERRTWHDADIRVYLVRPIKEVLPQELVARHPVPRSAHLARGYQLLRRQVLEDAQEDRIRHYVPIQVTFATRRVLATVVRLADVPVRRPVGPRGILDVVHPRRANGLFTGTADLPVNYYALVASTIREPD